MIKDWATFLQRRYIGTMSLPATLLGAIEGHTCFTGCYHYESPAEICTDPVQPPAPIIQVSCADCLSFRVGALTRLLPSGMTTYALADALTTHMRSLRGYIWSLSGYHAVGGGFWLSAAAFNDGLFLVDGSRNRSSTRGDADLLIEAFKHKLAPKADPRMLDPALYAAEVVYLSLAAPIGPVQTKQDIMASPQCSLAAKQGFQRVTVVEFLPFAPQAVTAQAPVSSSAPPPAPKPLERGDVCPVCHAEFAERALFTGTYVGCLC